MATCKAVVQEGPRKGDTCMFPPSENDYCGRHQRNRIYDEGIKEGKKWCRYFFRGCDSILIDKEVSCTSCRDKLTKKKHACEHSGCNFKVMETGFCKKHERDKYRKEEIEKGIRYCDIDRGCFNICKDKKSCEECLAKTQIVDNARYAKRKQITQILQQTQSTKRLCTHCGKDFEAFKTRYNNDSLTCKECSLNQTKQDEKRKDRKRNYKEEKSKNLENYYKEYITKATQKGREISIDFDVFISLVTSVCYYCNHNSDTETIGIDRIDNTKGYTNENCVPCCWKCNRMKRIYHPQFFIEKCKIMIKQEDSTKEFFNKWKVYYHRSCYKQFSAYIKDAEYRELPFELTEQQWVWLTRSACYLCGYQSQKGIGIDRVDNTIRAYTLDNCRPCCGSCNDMKGEFTLQEFLDQCSKIVQVCSIKDIPIVPIPEDPLKKVIDKGGLMPAEERKHWKALGLYYAILSDNANPFLESYSEVYTSEEFIELCKIIKEGTKETGVKSLQTLLQTLKKRKQRIQSNPTPST
jgi:hypothetical protein